MWGFIKDINNNYSNILQVVATIILVTVTVVYVVISCKTLKIVKQDFQARTEPEIQIIAPVEKKLLVKKEELIGTQYMLINTGFQARDVKVRTILYRSEKPDEILPALFQFKGLDEEPYSREVIPIFGQNLVLLASAYNYVETEDMGLIIIIDYYSPIKNQREIACEFYKWVPDLRSWRPSSKQTRDKMFENAMKSDFLNGFIDKSIKTEQRCH